MIRRGLLIAAALLATASTAHAGATLDRVTQKGVMVNVLINDYPPFSFIDDKNEVAGFDVDVAKAVADKLGVMLEIQTPAWEALVAGNWQGRWDVCICSMSPTAERAQVLDFVTHYYSSPAVLVVHKDETAIAKPADINGKKIGAGAGATYEAYLQKKLVIEGADKPVEYPFDQVEVVANPSVSILFQDLALGAGVRLDGIVDNYVTTYERIKAGGPFKIVGDPLYGEPNWVSTDKGDPEWNAKIKEVIDGLKADGTLKKISEKWVGADITSF